MKYKPVIGLEIHIELATASKMFCGCDAFHFNVEPNTHCCPVCLGLPGALPVPNRKAVDWSIMLGLALNCRVPEESKFDRKNYFYPDLPKGYQISQYDKPLSIEGKIALKDGKVIAIRRVHLEEDTGKLIHTEIEGEKATLIDFNRSGVPLVEVVTEPDFENAEQVDEFLKKLQLIVRYLGISQADMEKGSMRLEPNISVRTCDVLWTSHVQDELPPYKIEVKNINSFKFVRKAIDYEIKRQIESLGKGERLVQETRGWNETKGITVLQREKEQAHDYRYFPEPDIPPMAFSQDQILKIKSQIGELPDDKIKRFIAKYDLSEYNVEILCQEKPIADYFEETVKAGKKDLSPAQIANWIINKKLDISKTSPEELIKTIAESRQVFEISDGDLEKIIAKVIAENPKAVEDYKKGKTSVLGFLIGKVVSVTNPSIDKKLVQQKLAEKLRI
ncbi:MAG: Asp-tRNA(Asn)/Glu-tRNA(Gln) amidotransferase subunit GatB [bacterium]|nr:Asp-tRNA(Asn)/Glu-tRNA(Gln) amidotransferase subunit GatB [bacterium]